MARWEATLERSIVPARWQAEIEYAQCAANAVPHLLKRIEALRKALENCLYADGNAGEAQCAIKAAERALAADEAATTKEEE
ncbi:MAG: hypothetical protein KGI06_05805 [Candidatus Micrarchaeota archaeon]|nr:hypothetical protein [Candidatus Micrarchaeota archaeon]